MRWQLAASTATASASRGTPLRCCQAGRAYRHRQGRDLEIEPGKGAGVGAKRGRRPIPRHSRRCCARSTAPPNGARDAGNHDELARVAVRGRPMWTARPNGCCRRFRAQSIRPAAAIIAGGRLLRPARQGARPSRGRAMRCGSTRRWCAGVRSSTSAESRSDRARHLSARSLSRRAEAARRRAARRQCQGRRRAAVANAGRLGRRQPDARSRRIFRRRRFRSRPSSTLTSRRQNKAADRNS